MSAPCRKDVAESKERIREIAMGLHVRRIGGHQFFVDGELPAEAGEGTAGIAGIIPEVTVVLIADRKHASKGGIGRVLTSERRAQFERPGIRLERGRDVAAQEEGAGDVVVGDRKRPPELRVAAVLDRYRVEQGQRAAFVLQRSCEIAMIFEGSPELAVASPMRRSISSGCSATSCV